MNQIRKNINSLSCHEGIFTGLNNTKTIYYSINNDEEIILVSVPEYYQASEEIIDSSSEFVNGFKFVELSNNEYGYLREEDNYLLPYRYDIAFDFNENG